MQFSHSFNRSAEEVFEALTDPDSIIKKCLDNGALNASCESDGETLPLLKIIRTEAAELPTLMKKIVGDEQTVETEEQWSETEESYESSSHSVVVGTPIKIIASQSLYNTEDGGQIDVELTVKAAIPLVGKKVEPMVATKIRTEMLKEFVYIDS